MDFQPFTPQRTALFIAVIGVVLALVVVTAHPVFSSGLLSNALFLGRFSRLEQQAQGDNAASAVAAPVLTITKSAAASVKVGVRLTYTLTINNQGTQTAANLVITDTLPTGAHYVSSSHSGQLQGKTVTWAFPSLPVNNTITRRLVVTATQTLTNADYGVRADGGVRAGGAAVVTQVEPPYLVATTHRDFLLPGTQPSTLNVPIPDPTDCAACHTAPIYDQWRGSMMGQAGRDPLFWAALAVANQDANNTGEFCLRCHAVTGWLEGRSHVTDGSALQLLDIDAGIACEVCHRMVDPVPATAATDQAKLIDQAIRQALTTTVPTEHSGSAMFILDPEDRRRGSFDVSVSGVTHSFFQTAFLGQAKDAITESRLCGTCHNIDNPALSWDAARQQYWPNALDTPPPSFAKGALYPIESTYDEWLNSAYPQGVHAPQFAGAKADGMVASCQDCHMKRSTGFAAAEFAQPIERDCQTTGCLPTHTLMGGNTWVPQLLKDTRWRLHNSEDAAQLDLAVAAAEELLQKAATVTATLTYSGVEKVAIVRVINESGHKLPTGYAEGRRMWLQLNAYNEAGEAIYTSGAYNGATGELTVDATTKVYEVHQGLTPELAALVKLEAGPSFHFVLNNTVYKDNRIPPCGYTVAAYDRPGLKPIGATYGDGQDWDETRYGLPADAVRISVTLYYQTAAKEYIDFLRTLGGADGAVLGQLWDSSKSPPVAMATSSALLTGVPATPTPTPQPTLSATPTPTATPIGSGGANSIYLPLVEK